MMRFYGKDVLSAFDASLLGLRSRSAPMVPARFSIERQMAAVA